MNKKALVEAALYVSDKPISIEKLSTITQISTKEIKDILIEIQQEFQKQDRGIELTETPEGYEFRIRPEYRSHVSKLAPLSDLTEGMLRTLAIVTLKQPVKQSIIVRYQGNKAYGYIVALEKKGLIKTEKFGRTKLITTTTDFERYFGKSSEELKKILSEERT
ncbi:MAG: SMC-Scp complex subunit ScpB [Candidatus Aenigmatarchaeota archaeon]